MGDVFIAAAVSIDCCQCDLDILYIIIIIIIIIVLMRVIIVPSLLDRIVVHCTRARCLTAVTRCCIDTHPLSSSSFTKDSSVDASKDALL